MRVYYIDNDYFNFHSKDVVPGTAPAAVDGDMLVCAGVSGLDDTDYVTGVMPPIELKPGRTVNVVTLPGLASGKGERLPQPVVSTVAGMLVFHVELDSAPPLNTFRVNTTIPNVSSSDAPGINLFHIKKNDPPLSPNNQFYYANLFSGPVKGSSGQQRKLADGSHVLQPRGTTSALYLLKVVQGDSFDFVLTGAASTGVAQAAFSQLHITITIDAMFPKRIDPVAYRRVGGSWQLAGQMASAVPANAPGTAENVWYLDTSLRNPQRWAWSSATTGGWQPFGTESYYYTGSAWKRVC